MSEPRSQEGPVFTLTNLTVNEINSILTGLQELPGKICNPLSAKIHKQLQDRLSKEQANKEIPEQ